MDNYKKRIADEILQKKLKSKGAVLIEGPVGVAKQQPPNKYLKVFYIWQILKIKNKT